MTELTSLTFGAVAALGAESGKGGEIDGAVVAMKAPGSSSPSKGPNPASIGHQIIGQLHGSG
jgi:hypothetical protein